MCWSGKHGRTFLEKAAVHVPRRSLTRRTNMSAKSRQKPFLIAQDPQTNEL